MKPQTLTLLAALILVPISPNNAHTLKGAATRTKPAYAGSNIAQVAQQNNSKLSEKELQQLAQSITVKVSAKNNSGSGTIIRKEGQTYTILTNAHVVELGEPFKIITPDGKTYSAKLVKNIDFPKQDLALLQFDSPENYRVIETKTGLTLTPGEKVWAAGFAYDKEELLVTSGEISLVPDKPLIGGYSFGYSNEIKQGMSGGPVFNSAGELIGINGKQAYPIKEWYQFEDGSQPEASQIQVMKASSWGIPIATVITKVEAYSYIKEGKEYYEAWEYEKALESFNKAIEIEPNYADAYYYRAFAKLRYAVFYDGYFILNKAREEIIKDYQKAATLYKAQGKEGDSYRSEGYAYLLEKKEKRENNKAIQAFEQALRVNLDDVDAYLGRGDVYFGLEEYDQALADYNKAIELKPDYALAYQYRANLYLKKEEYDQSLADYNKVIELKPNSVIGYVLRGWIFDKKGDYQRAIADFNQGIELNSQNPMSYYFRGVVFFGSGKFEAALTDFNKVIEISPEYPPAYIFRSIVHNRDKNYQQAIADASKAFELGIEEWGSKDDAAMTYFWRGKSYFDLEQYSVAIADLEKAIQLFSETENDTIKIISLQAQEALKAAQQAVGSSGTTLLDAMTKVDAIAQKITVQINAAEGSKCNKASGVIIARERDTYTVLTAEHAVRETQNCNPNQIEIITPDQQRYQINQDSIKRIKGVDLAVLQFKSNKSYQVATLGNYDQNKELGWIFVSGFPASNNSHKLTLGYVYPSGQSISISSLSFTYGYQLIYNNLTAPGMSGGAILDRQGRVIGIHGRAEGEVPIDQLGTTPPMQLGLSLGIPIHKLLQYSSQIGINNNSLSIETTAPEAIGIQPNEKARTALLNSIPAPGETADAVAWLNYANQLFRLDLIPESIGALEKAIQIKPDFYQAWYLRGRILSIFPSEKQAALESLNKVVQLAPNFSPGWLELGDTLQDLEQHEAAIASFDKAIALDPEFAVAYFYRGISFRALKQYDKAIADYSKAIQLNPDYVFAYNNRGYAYVDSENYQKAIEDFSKAIELNPEYPNAYNGRGEAYYNLKKYDQAIADFSKAIEYNPKYDIAYKNRGDAYRLSEKNQEAIADYTKAIEIDPKYAWAYNGRAIAYDNLEEYDKALADYNKAIELSPKGAILYNNRGYTYRNLKEYNRAITDFNKALELDPKNYFAYNGLGLTYDSLKKYDQALVYYNKAIELNPENPTFYYNRGDTYSSLKDYQKALADFEQSIKVDPKYLNGYIGNAYIYRKLENYQAAIEQYNKALEIDPNFAWAYNGIGNVYYQQKDYQKAIEYYNQAIAKDQKFWRAIYNIGKIKYEMGEIDAAIEQWQTGLKIEQEAAEPKLALAVALYTKGQQQEAVQMAEEALKLDNELGNIDKLKDNLWGEKLLTDAQKLLETPAIQALISKKN